MTLSIEAAVRGVADALREKVAPTLTDNFATEVTRLSTNLLTIMANAADDAVALRVEENARVRTLLGDGAAVVGDTVLAARLAQAAASTDPGFRISELDRETDRLRRLLVELQVSLELQDDVACRTLNQRIWSLLRDIETSRAPRL